MITRANFRSLFVSLLAGIVLVLLLALTTVFSTHAQSGGADLPPIPPEVAVKFAGKTIGQVLARDCAWGGDIQVAQLWWGIAWGQGGALSPQQWAQVQAWDGSQLTYWNDQFHVPADTFGKGPDFVFEFIGSRGDTHRMDGWISLSTQNVYLMAARQETPYGGFNVPPGYSSDGSDIPFGLHGCMTDTLPLTQLATLAEQVQVIPAPLGFAQAGAPRLAPMPDNSGRELWQPGTFPDVTPDYSRNVNCTSAGTYPLILNQCVYSDLTATPMPIPVEDSGTS